MASFFRAVDWAHWPLKISPVIFHLGPLSLQWYSLMYVTALGTAYALARARLRRDPAFFPADAFEDFVPWLIFGVVAGARAGYVLFYDLPYYLQSPWEIILPFRWEGGQFVFTGIRGLSYHGGLLGGFLAIFLFCRRRKLSFWRLSDLLAVSVPAGYTFGRIGNFLNGELYGRETSVPWGMYFPQDPAGLLRHPSQLYEAALEGLLLFGVVRLLARRRPPAGVLTAAYITGYGVVRFLLEFFREPDPQLGFVFGPLSLGQVLCLTMAAAGIALAAYRISLVVDSYN
jgi:phosphatidylglycerol:prolipoprotein diacylglycerol transferase